MHRLWETMNEEVGAVVFWPVALGVIGIGTAIVFSH
jgi:hypothetical protein